MKKLFYQFLFVTCIITSIATTLVAQSWIGDSWAYRRLITVNNPGSTMLTDFQIKIELNNSNFDFLDANNDGSDIRVTANDGTTMLPFWIESWNPAGEQATIWVKVPNIPILGTTVYLYYGNANPVIIPGDPVETPPSGPFTKQPTNPIIPINVPVGRTSLLAENIVYDDITGHYWMVLTDQTSGATVCLVYSDDPTNPSAWYWGGVMINNAIAPHIMKYDNSWYIFYGDRAHGGPPYPIAVATSTNVNGPYTYFGAVLQAGALGTWEDYRVDEPFVFQRSSDGKWILLYMADSGGNVEQVGYAEADNIIGPYTKFIGNPCIPFGPSGTFDAGTVADPWVYEYDGVYYIGYTVSPSTSSPWQTALATTIDWLTFTKNGIILPRGTEYNSFRGAVTRIDDEYVFSYTGGPASGQYRLCIATQPVYQSPIDIISNPDAVFDFYDGFDGISIDLTKWTLGNGTVSQAVVASGLLTMTASSTYIRINGSSAFGMDYIGETLARHPNIPLSNMVTEYGFAQNGTSFDLRITDNFPTVNRWQRYVGTSVTNFGPTTDVNWHVLGLYRQSPGTAGFKIDDNSVETVNANVPTMGLFPFLMSYGNGNQFIVDWTRVRKFSNNEPTSTVGSVENNPLPVELSSFSASVIGSSIKLNWRTEIEVNNYGFEIERKVGNLQSSVGKYEKIGFVNGNGNSNSPKSYSYEDKGLTPEKYNYRLKQIDNDGQFEYSKTIEVNFGVSEKFELSQNYPNPFNPTTAISFSLSIAGNVKLTIYNTLGEEVKSLLNEFKESGTHTIRFDGSELNSGMYIFKLESGSFIQSRKMILLK